MPDRQLTGTRVRNRRLDQGLRQAEVARLVGISGSYLNLIEHNRRRIGGKLLNDLAHVLEIDPVLLVDGTNAAIISPLQQAVAEAPEVGADGASAEELVARFPAWASLIVAQHTKIAELKGQVARLTDRLAHDPQLATSLHDVISTATAIRSTASILVESPDLDADWRDRFNNNIDKESRRLAESSKALAGFLNIEKEAATNVSTPMQRAELFLAAEQHRALDVEYARLSPQEATADMADAPAQSIVRGWLEQRAKDAQQAPLPLFAEFASRVAYDPARLAEAGGWPLDLVFRRLAHLPDEKGHPPMGLAECDAAGVIIYQKEALDLRLPRAGAACPLWPLYQALTQPGRALRSIVSLPKAERTAMECFAIAGPRTVVPFGEEPRIVATMLVRAAPRDVDTDVSIVGPGCRLCPVQKCASRREPSILD